MRWGEEKREEGLVGAKMGNRRKGEKSYLELIRGRADGRPE